MVSHHKVVKDTAETGLMRLVRALAVILPSVALAQVLTNPGDYRQPAAAAVVWLAVLGASAWFVPRLRTGGLTASETAAAILIAVAAVAAIGVVHRAHGGSGSVDLAVLGTAWLLALVVMSRPARVWIPAALLVFAVYGVLLVRGAGLNPLSMSQLGAAGYIIVAVLVAFAALRPTLDTHVSMAARQASLAARSSAEHAAAAAIQQERKTRLAVLEQKALPLLRGIAAGTLDPTEQGVREECARYAAVLRYSLSTGAPGSGELVAGLDPVLRAAAARELPVPVQVIGDPGTVQPPVARAVVAAVDAVLSALAPQQVMLTVLASGDDVELYLTFSAPLRCLPDLTRFGLDVPAPAHWHAVVSTTETGGGCLEVAWRKDGAA
ncbi:MAG TPA: hypothetical protein VME19_09340 [Streptosporangiaceae bacterium]|nr:hypothetical protein [Streptosporangiaceae bacterium]